MHPLIESARRVFWRTRSRLGLRSSSDAELRYRLHRLPSISSSPGIFKFPWGDIHYVASSDLRGQYFEIFAQRHYAFHSETDSPVIVDAGGNIGMSAIWFKQAYPNAKVTVYEADSSLVSILSKNLAAANITDVDVQHAAVWDKDGTVFFDNRGQDKGMVSASGAIQVQAVDLASHLPARVDLLKLDVEGAEYAIIRRLVATGNITRVRNLVAEFHIKREDIDDVLISLRLLREAGMQVSFRAALGPWLGEANPASPFEIIGKQQALAEVYAWR